MATIKTKPVQAKICGITNEEDALWAANLGADFVGLNFIAESPRKISIEKARDIHAKVPPFVKCAGIFLDPSVAQIEAVMKKVPLGIIQFHGNESRQDLENVKSMFHVQVWKAIRVENEESLEKIKDFERVADAVLLDAFVPDIAGGTGNGACQPG